MLKLLVTLQAQGVDDIVCMSVNDTFGGKGHKSRLIGEKDYYINTYNSYIHLTAVVMKEWGHLQEADNVKYEGWSFLKPDTALLLCVTSVILITI